MLLPDVLGVLECFAPIKPSISVVFSLKQVCSLDTYACPAFQVSSHHLDAKAGYKQAL